MEQHDLIMVQQMHKNDYFLQDVKIVLYSVLERRIQTMLQMQTIS